MEKLEQTNKSIYNTTSPYLLHRTPPQLLQIRGARFRGSGGLQIPPESSVVHTSYSSIHVSALQKQLVFKGEPCTTAGSAPPHHEDHTSSPARRLAGRSALNSCMGTGLYVTTTHVDRGEGETTD